MSVLDVIDPPDCDEQGVPLDWERCRTCAGECYVKRWDEESNAYEDAASRCPTCDGHGSLKAAALARFEKSGMWKCRRSGCGTEAPARDHKFFRVCGEADRLSFGCDPYLIEGVYRCEDCGHPMSEGVVAREDPTNAIPFDQYAADALHDLRGGIEPDVEVVHFSPCDEGCRHDGPGRGLTLAPHRWMPMSDVSMHLEGFTRSKREASWRPVDVRTLGWAHDLRPHKLAVLCLRCYAERKK